MERVWRERRTDGDLLLFIITFLISAICDVLLDYGLHGSQISWEFNQGRWTFPTARPASYRIWFLHVQKELVVPQF